MQIVVLCRDCRSDSGRPKVYRQSCSECADDFVARHMADYPAHRLEMSSGHVEDTPRHPSRATRQLLGRAGGW